MTSKHTKITLSALLALAQLTSRGAQSDSAANIEAARKAMLIFSSEDSERLRSPDYVSGKIDELKGLIRQEILSKLNRVGWNDSTLLSSLAPALDHESYPLSLIHKQLNGIDFVIIGYSIRHGPSAIPYSTVVIDAYLKRGDGYELADQTGEGLANSTPKLEELPCPWTTEVWLLGHGQQTGVMQYHERARIYSFDGQHFKELWGHDPMREATFQIERNELKIEFVDEPASHAMELTLALLPQGPKEISLVERK